MTEPVLLRPEVRSMGRVAFLTINIPERLNALSSDVMTALSRNLRSLAGDPDLRALVLTGAGDRAFIGGADIREMAAFGDPGEARAFITRVHECCEALRDLPVPTLARINGFTFGAGLEVAAACDHRIASETSVFGMPEVRLGIPSVVEAALLPQLIGWGRTRELLLFGANISATEALDWGLVEQVTSAEALDAAIEARLDQLALCTPGAVRLQKALIRRWEDLPLRAAIDAGIDAFEAAATGGEPALAMRDFLERRMREKAGRS